MLREYSNEDRKQIATLIVADIKVSENGLDTATDKALYAVVWEDNGTVSGFGSLRRWSTDGCADLYLYVAPKARRQGIGSALLLALTDRAEREGLTFLHARESATETGFFEKHGFSLWYEKLDMSYAGDPLPDSDIETVPYTDEWFEAYATGLGESFYEMRKANDFRPHLCCTPDEKKKKAFHELETNTTLLISDGSLAGAVSVNGGEIEDLFVTQEYQGMGLGRKLLCHAVNMAFSSGEKKVTLSVVGWNKRALKLYESTGFETVRKNRFYSFGEQ